MCRVHCTHGELDEARHLLDTLCARDLELRTEPRGARAELSVGNTLAMWQHLHARAGALRARVVAAQTLCSRCRSEVARKVWMRCSGAGETAL